MEVVTSLINTLGFPIFVAVWCLIKQSKESKYLTESMNKQTEAINRQTDVINSMVKAIENNTRIIEVHFGNGKGDD
jgi:predicted solute-binding protein